MYTAGKKYELYLKENGLLLLKSIYKLSKFEKSFISLEHVILSIEKEIPSFSKEALLPKHRKSSLIAI